MRKENIDDVLKKEFMKINVMPQDMEMHIKNIKLSGNTKQKIIEIIVKIVAILGVCSCGTVLAVHYIDKYSNVYDKGVKSAIEDGYIYEVESVEYVEKDNVKVGIGSLLLDDYNFYLNMPIELKENIEGYENFKLNNVIIYDEQYNIFYEDNWNLLEKFIKEKNISENDVMLLSGIKGVSISNISGNTGIINFEFKETNNILPNSKKIYVEFGEIEFLNNIDKNKENIICHGEWKMEIDVLEKFQNRETATYQIENCDTRIDKESIKIDVTETGTKFNISMNWGDYEYWTKKTNEIRHHDVMGSRYIQTEKCYIENENGEKYYASFEGTGARLNTNGILNISCNFSFRKNNSTDKIKIVLVDINNESIELYFEK